MPKKPNIPIGQQLRNQREEVLRKGLREVARLLDITPPHLTDIEKGRRNPSEDLLLRICRVYQIAEADLRAGWSKPEAIVEQVANQNPMTAAKVPELLRKAKNLTPEQWDRLIQHADRMAENPGGK